jgi:formate-dependent nitrite reductase membrane component NrfD
MVHAPLFKYWSPMSVGSLALSLFGLCSFISFVATVWPNRWLGRALRPRIVARVFAVIGCLVGFFLAAYTGALLTATNQPIWSDSVWIAPLFLASAASTGLAAMMLLVHWRSHASMASLERLERADVWALGLELVVFAIFLLSLGDLAIVFWHTAGGKIMIVGTLIIGLLAPLAIHLRLGMSGRRAVITAAALALIGGFFLRYGLLIAPPELLRDSAAITAGFGPEDGRQRGGGRGADPGNSVNAVEPRTKVFPKE